MLMKIVILGSGQVGATLAATLANEGHDISVIDTNAERLKDLQDRLDIRTVIGQASYPAVLRQAGAKDADMLIAVTNNDEVNMVACQVAYSLFSIPRKIARIRSPHYFIRRELFGRDDLPIDVFISPEQIITDYVKDLIDHPGALQVLNFADGRVRLVGVKPHYGGPLVGKTLAQIKEYVTEVEFRVAAIYRGESSIPLNGDTVIDVGDEIFFIAANEHIRPIMAALRRLDNPYRRIMIAGGGNIGFSLAKTIEDDYHVKVIEHNNARCQFLSEHLKHTTVLFGDAADRDLLINENIEHIDVFAALTNDDEANIMSCMLAKRLGARLVIALVTRPEYTDLIEDMGINIAISPQQATTGSILAQIRRGDVVNLHSLRRGAAEAIEAVAHGDKTTSKVVGLKLSQIKLPQTTTIGAIVRGDDVVIPHHGTVIESEDHVILFVADKKHIRAVEKLFQVSATFL